MSPGGWLEGAFEGDVEALPVGSREAGLPARYSLRLLSGRLRDVRVVGAAGPSNETSLRQDRLEHVFVQLDDAPDESFRCALRNIEFTNVDSADEGVRDERRYRRVKGRLRGYLGFLEEVIVVRDVPPAPPGPIERRTRPIEDPTAFRPARWRPLAALGLSWKLVGVLLVWVLPLVVVAVAAVSAVLFAVIKAVAP